MTAADEFHPFRIWKKWQSYFCIRGTFVQGGRSRTRRDEVPRKSAVEGLSQVRCEGDGSWSKHVEQAMDDLYSVGATGASQEQNLPA
jgi:hypothetical protein